MSALAGDYSFGGTPLAWNLFFARHPEPDLEFTEEELEETTSYRSSPPPTKAPKPSGGKRPLVLLLLLVLIGGGAYVAMDPEMFMEYLGPLLGESPTPQAPPPAAMKPAVPKPTPPPVAQAPAPVVPPPAAPTAEVSNAPTSMPPAMPTTSSTPTVPPPSAPSAESAPPAIAFPAPTTAAAIGASTPLFSEGQRVVVLPNQTAPGNAVPLMHDAAGTKPNLAVPAGTVLTILDGDFQSSGWVYSVRSSFGDKGWIAEKQLKLKP